MSDENPSMFRFASSVLWLSPSRNQISQLLGCVLSASLPSRGGWLILGELAIKGAWGRSWLACRLRWPGDHIHRLSIRSFPPAVRVWHGALKLLSKVFKHNPPDQRGDNGDREIHTRDDIAQGERYTLSYSISRSEFPHQEI